MQLLTLTGLLAFSGLTLVFSEIRWFRRPHMTDRLAPYAPGRATAGQSRLFSVASFREVVTPLAHMIGERVARTFGVREELEMRLLRIHSPLQVTAFRLHQLGWAAAALVAGSMVAVAFELAAPVAILLVLGAPVLAFLVREQQVVSASEAWQRKLFLELPVVAEQLGMLTAAGWSLGAAMSRIASRGSGNCAADLVRVTQRMRQGLGEREALLEWGDLAKVDSLDRLISILALDREATDLGSLISEEARAIRRESQRELIESIEQRNQKVWVPVTVAALIPGVLLMGIPFIDALTLFSTS